MQLTSSKSRNSSVMKTTSNISQKEKAITKRIKDLIDQWFRLSQTNKQESEQKFEEAKALVQELKALRNT